MVNDYVLSQLAISGDEDAFKNLYDKYHNIIYKMMYRSTRNNEESEDLVQDVFLQLYRKLHTFRGESKFSTWLYRLSFNILRMNIRKNHAKNFGGNNVLGSIDDTEHIRIQKFVEGYGEEGGFQRSILSKDELNRVFYFLEEKHKQVLVLRFTYGYHHTEIARQIGVHKATSKNRQFKAISQLRDLLSVS